MKKAMLLAACVAVLAITSPALASTGASVAFDDSSSRRCVGYATTR